jgi:fibronectin type 3 domain-containing protein
VITYTPIVSTAPSAPTNLTSTSVNGGVSLSWTAPSSDPGITSYGIYRDTVASSTSLFAVTTSTSTATYTDSTTVRGTNYYYRVVAVNSVGTSTYSNEKYSGSNSGRIIRMRGMRLR